MEKQTNVSNGDKTQAKVHLFYHQLPIIELDLKECDLLGEIKPVLLENPLFKIHPNIIFTYQGKHLKMYQPLSQQIEILPKIDINIEIDTYSEREAHVHVSNLSKFFLNPHSFLYENFLEFNVLLGKTESLEQSLNDSNEIKIVDQSSEGDQEYSQVTFLSNQQKVQFFKKLSYSSFNPPSGIAKMQGDLLYLDFISFEGINHTLVIHKNGCFSNSSTLDQYNPKPKSQNYKSLIELLSNLSPHFNTTIKQFIDPNKVQTYKKYSNKYSIVSDQDKLSFFHSPPPQNLYDKLLYNLIEILKNDKNGLDFTTYRDWNEEFQNCKQFDKRDPVQEIHRIKILRKTQKDFEMASQKLAIAVVENKLLPINPSESKIENCYVYNNLFATYALDTLDWEQPKTEVSPSTYSTVNNDLKNLQILSDIDIKGVNTINTCTVDYLGHRVIIQCVIQGILHFDQNTWQCYGSIDEGKTMNRDEEFHGIMKGVCEKFYLSQDLQYKNQEGEDYCFNGSPEVKGIKAGDGRRYIMDLMRLSVRDMNYQDKSQHECCVLRPELIKSYLFYQNIQKSIIQNRQKLEKQQKLKEKEEKEQEKEEKEQEEKKEKEKEKKEKKEEKEEKEKKEKESEQDIKNVDKNEKKEEDREVKNVNNEDEKEVNEQNDKQQQVQENNQIQNDQDIESQPLSNHKESYPMIKSFNPSIQTNIESLNDNYSTQKEDLIQVSQFLKKNIINVYLNNLFTNPIMTPLDSESLIEQLHKNGINVRYLGYMYKQVKERQNYFLKKLFQRTIIVKSFVKFMRSITFENNSQLWLQILVQKMNILLGNEVVHELINQKIKNMSQTHKNNSKKNKKKKKKKIKLTIYQDKENQYLKMNINQFLMEIVKIGKERYSLEESIKEFSDFIFLKSNTDKVSFMREVMRRLGIQLNPKKYNFECSQSNPEYPLKVKDITGFKPLIKSINHNIQSLQYNYKQIEQEIVAKKYESALQMLKATQHMIINTYGIYNQDFIFNCSKLSNVYFLTKETDKAIKVQSFVVQLSEKVFGIDHHNTAFAILELSNYYFENKNIKKTLQLHKIALYLFDLIASPHNPNSLFCLRELQMLTEGQKMIKQSTYYMEQLLQRNEEIFGNTDQRLLYFLEKLANLKSQVKDYQSASLFQARYHLILSRFVKKHPDQSQLKQQMMKKLEQSKKLRDTFMKNLKIQKN